MKLTGRIVCATCNPAGWPVEVEVDAPVQVVELKFRCEYCRGPLAFEPAEVAQ